VTVRLRDGREFVQDLQYFPGMPQRPLSEEQLWDKFATLTASIPRERARHFFNQFLKLEAVDDVGNLEVH
jgi:hypothetical protein